MKWMICLVVFLSFEAAAFADPVKGQKSTGMENLHVIPWDSFSAGSELDVYSDRYRACAFLGTLPSEVIESDGFSVVGGFLNPEFIDILTSVKDWHDFGMPVIYRLYQNYPNPFNPATTIRYSLPEKCYLRLDVYDLLGRWVTTMREGDEAPGYHLAQWDGRDAAGYPVSTGIYFYRLSARSNKGHPFIQSRKMLLVK